MTLAVSKQLLPVYNKPMIYYPISTLMLAGIRDILIITTPGDSTAFQKQLGDGKLLGVNFSYAIQEKPSGIAEALILGKEFLKGDSVLLILGDNIFHGAGLGRGLTATLPHDGAHIFTYEVSNPNDYGIISMNEKGDPISIQEKPQSSDSNMAVTGLYFFDSLATEFARKLKPSTRGELEITSLIEEYLNIGKLRVTPLSRGSVWLDTGNPNAMNDASNYVRVIEERTGLMIACLEEIAWRNQWIGEKEIMERIKLLNLTQKKYLLDLLNVQTS